MHDALTAALIVLLSVLIGIASLGLIRMSLTRVIKSKGADKTIRRIKLKYYLLFLLLGVYAVFYLSPALAEWRALADTYMPIFMIILLAYLSVRVFDGIVYSVLEELARKTETEVDDMLLPILRNAVYILLSVVAIALILSKLGYDVSVIVAALGVAGLGFSLASQSIIESFFGGMLLIVDKTFLIGDKIKVKGYEGKVVEISLRSTRIQLDDKSIVSIPNSIMLKEAVLRRKER